jgi:glycosyltransferase involved in cell wall biosynthesis
MREGLSAWADLLGYRIPPALWDAICRFSPQLILSNLGSIRQIQLTTALAKKLAVWVVPFFHDDWPSTMYTGNRMTAYPRLVLESKLTRCLRLAPTGIGNSDEMVREYSVRFLRPFHTFTNCIEAGEYEPPVTRGGDVEFTYVGGLGLGRWKSLADVADAIAIARQQGTKAILNIYGPVQDLSLLPARLLNSDAVRIGGSVSGEDATRAVRNSDVLVHVESFDRALRDYTRLSFSTKLPLYMAAGRPVLAFGPDEGASCRYVREHGFGRVVTEPGIPRLAAAITDLSASEELRASLGRSAWQRALDAHSSSGMHARFRDLISAVAELPQPPVALREDSRVEMTSK